MSKLPVIPNCGVKDNKSSPEAKLPLIVTAAVSICVSSRSSVVRLPVMFIGAPFSMYKTGAASMAASVGGSFTAVNCTSLDTRLLLSSPSLTTKSIVRVSTDGLSLVF